MRFWYVVVSISTGILHADHLFSQTFWLFQTYLHNLASDPNSISFQTCRRIYNRVQRIIFGGAEPVRRDKIKENILPVSVLSSLVVGSVAAPFLAWHAGPLAVAQARRPRPVEDSVSDAVQQGQKLGRSHTVAGTNGQRPRRQRAERGGSDPEDQRESRSPGRSPRQRPSQASRDPQRKSSRPKAERAGHRQLYLAVASEARHSTSSLPELKSGPDVSPIPTPPATAGLGPRPDIPLRRHSHMARPLTPSVLPRHHKTRLLRSNYFRSETQFLSALEDISNRLVVVPKPARLSALRAELALIQQDLPAEVDIPLLYPATLEGGSASKSRHHRIVRINPAEATSLNSAERVPYLLMVEVLREDFDFDPDTEANQQLLTKILAEKGTSKRRLFDITHASRSSLQNKPQESGPDSVFEPANGDLGTPSLIKEDPIEEDLSQGVGRLPLPSNSTTNAKVVAPRSSSGTNITAMSTPRTSDSGISRTNSPTPRKMTINNNRGQSADQTDFSALATHMRTAAQMLAQLESSGSKRPKTEVAAIKARIIASMQSLEEQSFYAEDSTPTFDTIMSNTNSSPITIEGDEIEDGIEATDPGSSSGAGAARMENDQKTGGVQRKGDRDDPSAATFGEDWTAKRERIRRTSPYGWMKNWDLISVIVKTGADLRQEAFACQLIQVCSKIWKDADTPVWVKRMRILVTGESGGLIETITNGVSLHSLKRSLTLASIAAGTNPRKRIATLKDHYVKTFGDVDSEAYSAGVDAFVRSLAAYSIISYILQLKDRHNGNLLIDNFGHMIHIDFGFMLSNTPGSMGFEAAPFKLTQEYVDVMTSVPGADKFEDYKKLCKQAFQALRKDAERIVCLVELMGKASQMPCFSGSGGVVGAVARLRERFRLELSREEAEGFVDELVTKSLGSYYTRL